MKSDFYFVEEFKDHWNKKVKKLRLICFFLSAIMICIGIFCMIYPIETFDVMKILVSIAFICFGIYSIITYCITVSYFKDPIIVIIGITHILFGGLLYQMPVELTAMSLTMLLGVILMFYGAEKIRFSRQLRFFHIIDTSIYTYSGIISIVVSIVFLMLPLSSALMINYVIAIYLVVDGLTLLIEAIKMKKLENI